MNAESSERTGVYSGVQEVPGWAAAIPQEGVVNQGADPVSDSEGDATPSAASRGRHELSTSLPHSLYSEAGTSFWDSTYSVLTDHSETGSIGGEQNSSKGLHKRTKSKDSLNSDCGDSSSSKSKKRRRNRTVDIEEIIIEFDPQKEFLWEMRKKYEQEKERAAKKQQLSEEDFDIRGEDLNKHDMSQTSLSNNPMSSGNNNNPLESSQYTLQRSGQFRSEPNLYSSGVKTATSTSLTRSRSNTAEPDFVDSNGRNSVSQSDLRLPASYNLASSSHSEPKATLSVVGASCVSVIPISQGPDAPSDSATESREKVEVLVLHRLPGEKLGMGLSIESTGGDNDPVKGVFVESITPGGAADRATGGTKGLCIGDEILEVNGTPLREVSYSETVTFFREMPLRVIFMVRRFKNVEFDSSSAPLPLSLLRTQSAPMLDNHSMSSGDDTTSGSHSSQQGAALHSMRSTIPEGFQLHKFRLKKKASDSLGLTVVPSYGSTTKFYQIKRVLSSGACASDGRVKVGDRLVTYNGRSLRGISQSDCMSILKTPAEDIDLEILRQSETANPLHWGESSGDSEPDVMDARGIGEKTPQKNKPAKTDQILSKIEVEDIICSHAEVHTNQIFAQNNVKLAYSKPSIPASPSDSNTDDEDLDDRAIRRKGRHRFGVMETNMDDVEEGMVVLKAVVHFDADKVNSTNENNATQNKFVRRPSVPPPPPPSNPSSPPAPTMPKYTDLSNGASLTVNTTSHEHSYATYKIPVGPESPTDASIPPVPSPPPSPPVHFHKNNQSTLELGVSFPGSSSDEAGIVQGNFRPPALPSLPPPPPPPSAVTTSDLQSSEDQVAEDKQTSRQTKSDISVPVRLPPLLGMGDIETPNTEPPVLSPPSDLPVTNIDDLLDLEFSDSKEAAESGAESESHSSVTITHVTTAYIHPPRENTVSGTGRREDFGRLDPGILLSINTDSNLKDSQGETKNSDSFREEFSSLNNSEEIHSAFVNPFEQLEKELDNPDEDNENNMEIGYVNSSDLFPKLPDAPPPPVVPTLPPPAPPSPDCTMDELSSDVMGLPVLPESAKQDNNTGVLQHDLIVNKSQRKGEQTMSYLAGLGESAMEMTGRDVGGDAGYGTLNEQSVAVKGLRIDSKSEGKISLNGHVQTEVEAEENWNEAHKFPPLPSAAPPPITSSLPPPRPHQDPHTSAESSKDIQENETLHKGAPILGVSNRKLINVNKNKQALDDTAGSVDTPSSHVPPSSGPVRGDAVPMTLVGVMEASSCYPSLDSQAVTQTDGKVPSVFSAHQPCIVNGSGQESRARQNDITNHQDTPKPSERTVIGREASPVHKPKPPPRPSQVRPHQDSNNVQNVAIVKSNPTKNIEDLLSPIEDKPKKLDIPPKPARSKKVNPVIQESVTVKKSYVPPKVKDVKKQLMSEEAYEKSLDAEVCQVVMNGLPSKITNSRNRSMDSKQNSMDKAPQLPMSAPPESSDSEGISEAEKSRNHEPPVSPFLQLLKRPPSPMRPPSPSLKDLPTIKPVSNIMRAKSLQTIPGSQESTSSSLTGKRLSLGSSLGQSMSQDPAKRLSLGSLPGSMDRRHIPRSLAPAGGRLEGLAPTRHSTLQPRVKGKRSDSEPFQIEVLKGLLGIGATVEVTPAGVRVTEIQNNGPISKNGHIRVGDYILSVNGSELEGLSETKVHQILRLLPRGAIRIIATAHPLNGDENREPVSSGLETVVYERPGSSQESNITSTVEVSTSLDKDKFVSSDQNRPFIKKPETSSSVSKITSSKFTTESNITKPKSQKVTSVKEQSTTSIKRIEKPVILKSVTKIQDKEIEKPEKIFLSNNNNVEKEVKLTPSHQMSSDLVTEQPPPLPLDTTMPMEAKVLPSSMNGSTGSVDDVKGIKMDIETPDYPRIPPEGQEYPELNHGDSLDGPAVPSNYPDKTPAQNGLPVITVMNGQVDQVKTESVIMESPVSNNTMLLPLTPPPDVPGFPPPPLPSDLPPDVPDSLPPSVPDSLPPDLPLPPKENIPDLPDSPASVEEESIQPIRQCIPAVAELSDNALFGKLLTEPPQVPSGPPPSVPSVAPPSDSSKISLTTLETKSAMKDSSPSLKTQFDIKEVAYTVDTSKGTLVKEEKVQSDNQLFHRDNESDRTPIEASLTIKTDPVSLAPKGTKDVLSPHSDLSLLSPRSDYSSGKLSSEDVFLSPRDPVSNDGFHSLQHDKLGVSGVLSQSSGSRRSSLSSDSGHSDVSGRRAPPLLGTGRRESFVESLEKKRRESSSGRLKGLSIPSKRTSAGPVAELPKIGTSKSSGPSLPALGGKQQPAYQSLGLKQFRSLQASNEGVEGSGMRRSDYRTLAAVPKVGSVSSYKPATEKGKKMSTLQKAKFFEDKASEQLETQVSSRKVEVTPVKRYEIKTESTYSTRKSRESDFNKAKQGKDSSGSVNTDSKKPPPIKTLPPPTAPKPAFRLRTKIDSSSSSTSEPTSPPTPVSKEKHEKEESLLVVTSPVSPVQATADINTKAKEIPSPEEKSSPVIETPISKSEAVNNLNSPTLTTSSVSPLSDDSTSPPSSLQSHRFSLHYDTPLRQGPQPFTPFGGNKEEKSLSPPATETIQVALTPKLTLTQTLKTQPISVTTKPEMVANSEETVTVVTKESLILKEDILTESSLKSSPKEQVEEEVLPLPTSLPPPLPAEHSDEDSETPPLPDLPPPPIPSLPPSASPSSIPDQLSVEVEHQVPSASSSISPLLRNVESDQEGIENKSEGSLPELDHDSFSVDSGLSGSKTNLLDHVSPEHPSVEESPKEESSAGKSELRARHFRGGSDLDEQVSEGRGSELSSPEGVPISPSPTHSDADSGIDSTSRGDVNKGESSVDRNKSTSHETVINKTEITTSSSYFSGSSSAKSTLSSDSGASEILSRKYKYSSSSLSDSDSLKTGRTSDTLPVKNTASSTRASDGEGKETHVELVKGAVGLGFCIEGGKGSPLGDKPITVKRLFKGGTAAQGILQPGDVILSANDKTFADLTHYSAWNYLKSLPEGVIKLKLLRKK